MLDKVKKSEKISFFALIIFLITLIAFIPVVFSYKQIFGIGYYKFKKSFISDYSEGMIGIEIKINLEYWRGAQCRGVVTARTISSGNVQVHGITHIRYEIFAANRRYSDTNEIVDPAAQSWSKDFIVSVYEDENVSCTGIAEINFNISGLDQIIVLNFDMGYVVPINVEAMFYEYELPFIWIVFFYFAFIFLVVYYVQKKYQYIKSRYFYTEETKKRDEKFFKYISKKNQEKKKDKK